MRLSKSVLFATTMLFVGVTASAAFAQSAASAANDTEIVVTGTRLKLPDYQAPNPVVTITGDTIERRGVTNLTDFLKTVPALTNSLKSEDYANAADRGSVGLNELNLRNLGTERTLVLVNGVRHVPGDPGTQAVDVNSIPEALVDRVEVLTGGVSAIYGADAVSGVVNFILKDHYEGVGVRVQAGAATEGAGENQLGSLIVGHNFADNRGNIVFALEAENDRGVNTTDRSYTQFQNSYSLVNNPVAGGTTKIFARDVRYKDSAEGGAVYTNINATSFSGVSFQGDGKPWVDGIDGGSDYMIGGSGTLTSRYREQLLPPNQRVVLNGIFHFDLSPKITFFGEVKWAHTETTLISQPSFNYGIFVPIDNPYIPASIVADASAPGGTATPEGIAAFGLPGPGVLVGRDNFDLGHVFEDITRDTYRVVAGIKGAPASWLDYKISYEYGRTDTRDVEKNNRIEERFYAAADAVRDPATGNIVCRSNLDPSAAPAGDLFFEPLPPESFGSTFTPGPNSGCVPINIFGPNISQQGAAWINTTSVQKSQIEEHDFSAYISGRSTPLFELPAGPIAVAAGFEYRRESSLSLASEIQKQAAAQNFNISFLGQSVDSGGKFEVYEGYVEADAPILKDVLFAKNVSVGGAYRFSHYTSIGDTNTYNFNVNWQPVDAVMFRTTVARAVRAPNINNLYQPTVQTYGSITDPCDKDHVNLGLPSRPANCAAALTALGVNPATFVDTNSSSIPGVISGNPKLRPEVANTLTYGLVLTPRQIPHLSISLDYYRINISEAINFLDGQTIADKCYDLPQPNQYCSFISRDSTTGLINFFNQTGFNVAAFKTSGIDFTLRYHLDPANFGVTRDIGRIDFSIQGSKLEDLTFIELAGSTPDKLIGTVNNNISPSINAPVWQVDFNMTWYWKRLTVNYGYNWASANRRFTKETQRSDPNYVDSRYFYYSERSLHDIQVRYDVTNAWSIYAGANNVTDQQPDIADPQPSEPVSPLGRFLYVGLEGKF